MTWKCLGSSPNLNIVGGHDVLIGAATDRKSDPSLWISSDGAEWTKTQSLAAGVEVAPVATGFVAVPVWQGALNAVYTSADGLRWTGQPNPFRQTPMAQIASDGTRAVLLEEFEGPGGQSPGGVWVSSGDGASWTRYQLPILEGERPYSAAILGSHVVVSGQYDPPDQSPSEQVLWTADLPG